MAVSDNLGLYLPTREDYVSVKRDISDNFEEVDDFAGGVMNGLAIVADGDTHIAIASGQYVYIRNNPNGVSEGMYTANSAISANASIYPANVTSVSGGISNALNGKMPVFHTMQITVPSSRSQTATVSLPSGWTNQNCIIDQAYIYKFNGSNVYFSDTLASEGVTFVFTGSALTVITSASAGTGWLGETANVVLRKVQ